MCCIHSNSYWTLLTASSLGLAQNADVLVHEATNTYLPGVDKDTNLRLVTKDAKVHGHSTPFMVSQLFL